jgi:hypothetical protein
MTCISVYKLSASSVQGEGDMRGLLRILLTVTMLVVATIACDLEYHNAGGKIIANGAPLHFKAHDGDQFFWDIEVTPGKEYELSLKQADPLKDSSVSSEINCPDCERRIERSFLVLDVVRLTFKGATNGKGTVYMWWFNSRARSCECTIQLIEKPGA